LRTLGKGKSLTKTPELKITGETSSFLLRLFSPPTHPPFNVHVPRITLLLCPDQQFLDHLKARTENNVAWFKDKNNMMVPVMLDPTQGGTSSTAIFESQGDLQQILEEFAVNPQMSASSAVPRRSHLATASGHSATRMGRTKLTRTRDMERLPPLPPQDRHTHTPASPLLRTKSRGGFL